MSGCTQSTRPDRGPSVARAGHQPGTPGTEPESRPSGIRRSKAGKWRALALVLVHVLVVAHVLHWVSKGTTLSPLEPSEGMQFGLQGVVNAGLIFFALTILSTLVLGRWFCGWACHVVALQDACRWLLSKLHIRPRMVNLGLLATVPWLAFTYMFLMPIVRRWIRGEEMAGLSLHLYTQEFWKTFPTWPVALLTFAVCGFAIVYFLGAKGFCTYGCPYGAMFGIADQLAPVRIRVTDACEGCGHCTAVCSSNVKVHQEVRDFGMVVDPGCMKCLDCVSVCPKDALYVGFGKPALGAKLRAPPAHARGRAAEADEPARGATLARWLVLAAFMAATYAVLIRYNGEVGAYVNPWEWELSAVLTAMSLAVAFVFRGKARRKSEYTLLEEVLLGVTFLASMYGFRGWHGAVPLLFAFGLSALFAWSAVQALRLLFSREARVQRIVLKREGRFRPAGVVFALIMLVCFSTLGIAMRQQADLVPQGRSAMVHMLVTEGLRRGHDPEEAVRVFERALQFEPGSVEARRELGSALCRAGRLDEGIAQLEVALAADPRDAETHARLAAALLARNDVARALPHVEEAVRLAPDRGDLRLFLADVLDALGRAEDAARERARAASSAFPPSR